MKKVVVFLFIFCSIILCGCSLKINNQNYENIDMTPRQISVSSNSSTTDVVEQVKSSVVGIRCDLSGGYSIGSGVCIANGGYVLTNHHVIDGSKKITLYLADNSTIPASFVWSDSSLDIAVVKSASNLPYLTCSENNLKIGQDIIAIGTPLSLDFRHTVTKGIVSALSRTLQIESAGGYISYMQNLIQHDASINPGNSGGPLIDLNGEVVGINTLKASDAEGIGFAIPISVGKTAIEKLSINENWKQGYIGVLGFDVDIAKFQGEKISLKNGVYVSSIDKKSLCIDKILVGDIITKINDVKINNVLDLKLAMYKLDSGKITITLFRNSEEIIVESEICSR